MVCPFFFGERREMEKRKHLYLYVGPVYSFKDCVEKEWKQYTRAVSEAQAISNLKCNWKVHRQKAMNMRVELPGVLTLVEN